MEGSARNHQRLLNPAVGSKAAECCHMDQNKLVADEARRVAHHDEVVRARSAQREHIAEPTVTVIEQLQRMHDPACDLHERWRSRAGR